MKLVDLHYKYSHLKTLNVVVRYAVGVNVWQSFSSEGHACSILVVIHKLVIIGYDFIVMVLLFIFCLDCTMIRTGIRLHVFRHYFVS